MNFYALGDLNRPKGPADTEWLPVEGAATDDAPRCPICGSFIGPRPLLPIVDIELKAWGHEWGDLAFGVGDELLMSERAMEIMLAAGIKGLEGFLPTRTVRATAKIRGIAAPPQYVAARLNRGCATVDERRSGMVRKGPTTCYYCRTGGVIQKYDGIFIEDTSWKGCDIFYPWGMPGTILVSERFRALCQNASISNSDVIPAENCKFDFYRKRP